MSDRLQSYSDFATAAIAILRVLQHRLGFDLWMITRTVQNDWIVLQAEDRGYGVQSGDSFCWADSFCSRMVQGLGPQMHPTLPKSRPTAMLNGH